VEAPVISSENVSFGYDPERLAVKNLSLDIAVARRVALLGANGAGKSTLLLLLNGTLKPSGGEIRLDGRAISYRRSELALLHRQVGIVLQDPDDQLFAPTVEQDIAFGLLNTGVAEGEARAAVAGILDSLGIASLARRPVHELSLGEKKRVALAGVLVLRPRVILLDEPTAGLDHDGAAALLRVLEDLHRGGATLIVTTHDTDLAYEWAEDAAILAAGELVLWGQTPDVLSQIELVRKAHLKVPFLLEVALECRVLCPALDRFPLPRDRMALFEQMRVAVGSSARSTFEPKKGYR
jgi:cobalt/nickel transport system ATP-binding protein